MSLLTLGTVLLGAAAFVTIALYRLEKFGTWVNTLPYVFWALGSAILIIDLGFEGVKAGLIVLGVIVVIHVAVLFDVHRDRKSR